MGTCRRYVESRQYSQGNLMRKSFRMLLLVAAGLVVLSTGALAERPSHPKGYGWRGEPYRRAAPPWRGTYWGTFNDIDNNPSGYHCGGGAYISCAPNW